MKAQQKAKVLHPQATKIIALDARPLTSPLSGVARVISEILLNFPCKRDFLFRLYANRPCHSDFAELLEYKHVEWHTVSGPLAKKGGLWFNLQLPWMLRTQAHKADLFWGSQQILPPFLPKSLPAILTYYDLVLYYFPKAMRPIARFQQRLFQGQSVRRATEILSISAQTRDDMCRHFAYPKSQAKTALLGYTKVGHDATELTKLTGLLGFFPDKNYCLAVSTIEPRKNYSALLKAWSRAARREANTLPLVIAGRRGWETAEFYHCLDALLAEFPTKLFVLTSLSDRSLDALYSRAAFFCMPSLYEGFGLPVLEALAHGLPGIVSDLPCFHEIGSGFLRYLPPKSLKSWESSIIEFSQILGGQKHWERQKDWPQANTKKSSSKKKPFYKKYPHAFGEPLFPKRLPEGLKNPAAFSLMEWSWKRTAEAHCKSFCRTLGLK